MLPTTYTLHARILTLLASISQKLGEVKAAHLQRPSALLERAYRVSTLHATLAIEGSPLDKRPIADLLAGHPHPTPSPASLEVANTQRVLELLPQLDPFVASDFRRAHAELMHGLALDAGSYRTGPVEVLYEDHYPARTAPAQNLASQVEELLNFVETDDAPVLITSCVLHYGVINLRPFSAGNGRMGRLWQKRVLMRQWPVFAFLPVEGFLLSTLPAYNASIGYADMQGDCGNFITYMMEQLDNALSELLTSQRPVLNGPERMALFLAEHAHARFTRRDYRRFFPELSTATASRDLADAVKSGSLELTGSGRVAGYRARA